MNSFGDVRQAYTGIIIVVKRGIRVEVADVEAGKAGVAAGQDTVDDKFSKFERASWHSNITGAAKFLATNANGNAGAIGIFLVGLVLTHYFSVDGFSSQVKHFDPHEGFFK